MSDARTIDVLERPPDATVPVPGSKSITNRALPLAAIAAGRSVLHGVGEGDDVEAMLEALRTLGVAVDLHADRTATVHGTAGALPAEPRADALPGEPRAGGLPGEPRPGALPAHHRSGALTIDTRQSGTTTRFLLAMAAAARSPIRITADPQMQARPLVDGVDAIRQLGATVAGDGTGDGGTGGDGDTRLPLTIVSADPDAAPTVTVRGDMSSQFLSGLLLSGALHPHGLTIEVTGHLVSRPYVDMTIAVLAAFGVTVDGDDEHRFVIPVGSTARGCDYTIEPDASSASYFFGAAALTGGRVTVPGLGSTSLQGDLGFVHLLESMGAVVEVTAQATSVTGPPAGELRGIDADLADLSDTVPTLAAVAALATSPTRIRGVGFIRHKESDRIGNVVRELRRAGVDATETDDGMVIDPTASTPQAARLVTYDDHRLAMAFSLLGLRTPGIIIDDPGCVAKTYPSYWDHLEILRTEATNSTRL